MIGVTKILPEDFNQSLVKLHHRFVVLTNSLPVIFLPMVIATDK